MQPNRKQVLLGGLASLASVAAAGIGEAAVPSRPNVVVILADDMGYGDLSLHGNPTINTPNIDRMAHEGTELTSFYTAPVCTPARGMFLTSRYPPRTGLYSPTGPAEKGGIRDDEITLANLLKKQGYATAMFGKWHLGDFDTEARLNPVNHGFDRFLGIPYSHDYNPAAGVPLYRGLEKVEQPVVYQTMTRRFTQEAVKFITENRRQPFFIYLAHPMPHVPVGSSPEFAGHSRAGRYGDAVEEVDWSVGQVLATLKSLNLDKTTIVVFMSDNGPWLMNGEATYDRAERGVKQRGDVGTAGMLRGAKTSTWEGGIRVPAIFRWPGRIPAGRRSADMVSVMDLLPTFVGLAGGAVPADRAMDGLDILPFLTSPTASSPRREFFYFLDANLQAVRQGPWKLALPDVPGAKPVAPAGGGQVPAGSLNPEIGEAQQRPTIVSLFNLDTDAAERYNVAVQHPDLVAALQARIDAANIALKANASLPQPAA